MSHLPLQGARFPRPPLSLCAFLALLLVAQQGPLASGESAELLTASHPGLGGDTNAEESVPGPAHRARVFPATWLVMISFFLFAPAGPVAAVVRELRCICLTTQSIHPSLITELQLILPGPHCSRLEIL